MKKDIHPEFHSDAKISCACGAEYLIGSTVKEVSVELCAKCHPFYTGKQKIIDTARRVEKFATRLTKKADKITSKTEKRAKRAKEKEDKKAKEDSK
jgi:large subunit ribosomal protein L31